MFSACFIVHIYSFPSIFTTNIAHTHEHTHEHTHAHLPLTVILRVVWVRASVWTRGKPAKMPEKGKVRENSGEGSWRCWRANRSSAAKWRQTNRTILELVPSEVSLVFKEKANDWRNWKPRCSRPILKLEIGKILWLLPLNISSKW